MSSRRWNARTGMGVKQTRELRKHGEDVAENQRATQPTTDRMPGQALKWRALISGMPYSLMVVFTQSSSCVDQRGRRQHLSTSPRGTSLKQKNTYHGFGAHAFRILCTRRGNTTKQMNRMAANRSADRCERIRGPASRPEAASCSNQSEPTDFRLELQLVAQNQTPHHGQADLEVAALHVCNENKRRPC